MASLEAWKYRVEQLLTKFTHLDNQHIYRQYNTEADDLSKKKNLLQEGTCLAKGFKSCLLIFEHKFRLY